MFSDSRTIDNTRTDMTGVGGVGGGGVTVQWWDVGRWNVRPDSRLRSSFTIRHLGSVSSQTNTGDFDILLPSVWQSCLGQGLCGNHTGKLFCMCVCVCVGSVLHNLIVVECRGVDGFWLGRLQRQRSGLWNWP